jgi:Leucine-rich repeat (LRR) protein
MEEKIKFLRDDIFLIARIDEKTGKQTLVMQKINKELDIIEIEDSIECIHTAVAFISVEDFANLKNDVDGKEELFNETLNIRSTENLREIVLEPEEKFKAFKSWVFGIAEAGYNAFKLQSAIEDYGNLMYPIASKLLLFMAKADKKFIPSYLDKIQRDCMFEGVKHKSSLIANLTPILKSISENLLRKKEFENILKGIGDIVAEIKPPISDFEKGEFGLIIPYILENDQNFFNHYLKEINKENQIKEDDLRKEVNSFADSILKITHNSYRETIMGNFLYQDKIDIILKFILKIDLSTFIETNHLLLRLMENSEDKTIHEKYSEIVKPYINKTYKNVCIEEGIALYSIEKMIKTKIFDVSNNDFNEQIPFTGYIAKNGHVIKLYLSNRNNHFMDDYIKEIPDCIQKFDLLQELNMTMNEIKIIPKWVGNLRFLQVLSLHNNKISIIPENLKNLTRLRKLSLSSNQIKLIPNWINELKSLEILDVRYNKINTISKNLSKIPSLNKFFLEWNEINEIPRWMTNIKLLTELDLGGNNITEIPDWIDEFKTLKFLGLDGNEITSIPESIGNMQFIECLSFESNEIISLPDSIGNLKSLETLILNHNKLSSIPKSIGKLTQLQILEISGNEMTSLPLTIKNLKSLTSLNLSYNSLETIPDQIKNLKNLKYLRMDEIGIKILPNWIGNLSNLELLSLRRNELTSIPETIGKLKLLKNLFLEKNKLRNLAKTIGNLINLKSFHLSANPLESIPETILNLKTLDYIELWRIDPNILPDGSKPFRIIWN